MVWMQMKCCIIYYSQKPVPHPAKKLSTKFLVPIAYSLATVAL